MLLAWNNNRTLNKQFCMNIARYFNCVVFTWISYRNRMKFRMKFMNVSFRLFLMRKIRMRFMQTLYEIIHVCLLVNALKLVYRANGHDIEFSLSNMFLIFFSSFLILFLRKFCKALEIKIFVSVFCFCVYVFFRDGGSWFVCYFFYYIWGGGKVWNKCNI